MTSPSYSDPTSSSSYKKSLELVASSSSSSSSPHPPKYGNGGKDEESKKPKLINKQGGEGSGGCGDGPTTTNMSSEPSNNTTSNGFSSNLSITSSVQHYSSSGGMDNQNKNVMKSSISIDDAIETIGMGQFQFRILVAAGLCFAADSMEILLLSFLSVVLQAQWDLREDQAATMTSVVFLGALVGTLVLGTLGDSIGRRPVFSLTAFIICFFGFATAITNNYIQLVICRFLVGFGVGGLTVPFDTLAEFIPDSHRGNHLLLIEYFWTAGTLLVPIIAMFTLKNSDQEEGESNKWRIFVFVCGIPCLISSIVSIFYVPESPRWLLTKGKRKDALVILRDAAKLNGHNPDTLFPEGTQFYEDSMESENFGDLFKPEWRRTTFFLWLTWAGFAFTYFGTIITVTLVFASGEELEEKGQYSFDYGAILASACSEIAGTTLVYLLIDRIGRVPLQVFSYLGGGMFVFFLCLLGTREDVGDGVEQNSSRLVLIVIAFLARMCFMGGSCTTWVSTAEILSTEIRTTGHSSANAVARLSGAMSPFLVTSETPLDVVGGILLVISALAAFASWNLPETMGKALGIHKGDDLSSKPKAGRRNDDDDGQPPQSGYGLLE